MEHLDLIECDSVPYVENRRLLDGTVVSIVAVKLRAVFRSRLPTGRLRWDASESLRGLNGEGI